MDTQDHDISVRELAEFVHRRGDLGGESTFRRSNRALEGSSIRIGPREPFLNLESIKEEFLYQRLVTNVPDGSRIQIEGMGEFTTGRGNWSTHPEERVREIESIIAQLKGEPDPIRVCVKAFDIYQKKPTKENRAGLKEAYEAVPEHLRMYCGDMDSKDYPIQLALQENDDEAASP